MGCFHTIAPYSAYWDLTGYNAVGLQRFPKVNAARMMPMNRLLCYAHYDESGTVRPFVKHALSSMALLCSSRIFVSNSPLADDDLEELRALCADVLVNDNTGYDFYMWKLALQAGHYERFDEVVLMNSSIYGPLFPLDGIFAEMEDVACDFWGITECFKLRPHVQSYFLVFRKNVLSSPRFRHFWDGILPFTSKQQVIQGYEVGITQWLVESGFRPAVYCDFDRLGSYCRDVGRRLRKNEDVAISHAAELLQIGSPFLKCVAVRNGTAGRETVRSLPAAGSYPLDDLEERGTVQDKIACPLCGAPGKVTHKRVKDYLNRYNLGRYDYYRCGNTACAVLWQIPPHPEGEVRTVYGNFAAGIDDAGVGKTGKSERKAGHTQLASLLKGADRLFGLPGKRSRQNPVLRGEGTCGKILVIGCFNAELLSDLDRAGWDVTGIETDGRALARLRRRNIDVRHGILDTGDLESCRFDRVLLVNALEHSGDPARLLAESFRVLKPGGGLHLITPNVSAVSRFLFRKYWFGLNAPRHRIIHSIGSLRGLISSAGFRLVTIETSARNAEEYAMHSLDGLNDRWTSFIVAPRIGREFLPRALGFAFAAVNMITRRHGDECQVYAEKNTMSTGDISR
jgi:rhamnosyltransferase